MSSLRYDFVFFFFNFSSFFVLYKLMLFFLKDFDDISSREFASITKSELELYLEENKLPSFVEGFDVLVW